MKQYGFWMAVLFVIFAIFGVATFVALMLAIVCGAILYKIDGWLYYWLLRKYPGSEGERRVNLVGALIALVLITILLSRVHPLLGLVSIAISTIVLPAYWIVTSR